MIVTCSGCSKRYMLDDALLPKEGRLVRCLACHHVWRQVPDVPSSLNPPPFLGFPSAEGAVELSHFPKRRKAWFSWTLCLVMLLSLISILVVKRHRVVDLWPSSQRMYDFLALQVNSPGAGLAISHPTFMVRFEGTQEKVVVAGDLTNTSDQVRPIPVLMIKLMGNGSKDNPGREEVLDTWEYQLSEKSLLPGESLHFETTPRPKPYGTHYVAIEF